jgi:hypothetical protein
MKNGPYTLVVAPPEWPGKRYRGRYCYEHHLVFWRSTGHILLEDENIHHVNGDKRDNSAENLEVKTSSEHTKFHHVKAEYVTLSCDFCGSKFSLLARQHRSRLKVRTSVCCSHSCSAKKQALDGNLFGRNR